MKKDDESERGFKYSDNEIISMYRDCKSITKVSDKIGCHCETVRRILIRNGIERRKRKPVQRRGKSEYPSLKEVYFAYCSCGFNQKETASVLGVSAAFVNNIVKRNQWDTIEGTTKKITDEELAKEAMTMTSRQIAKKHNMALSTVIIRARKAGIGYLVGKNNDWFHRAERYGAVKDFDFEITLDSVIDRFGGVCQLCGEKTDRGDVKNGHIGRMYPTVDHVIPLSKGGRHTVENTQLAHMHCNSRKCDSIQEGRRG